MNKFKLAFLAIGISFAVALTFSCSGDNEPGGSESSVDSSSGTQGSLSSSSGTDGNPNVDSSSGTQANLSSSSGTNVDTDGKNVEELLADGIKSLKAEQWDEAVAYYDAAYKKDNNDAKAVIYSVLANLAKISIDPKIVSLMKEHLGFTRYPNKLNALFSKDWLEKTPDYIKYRYCDGNDCGYWYDEYELKYYDLDRVGYYRCNYNDGYVCTLVSSTPQYDYVYLPDISTPTWVKGGNGVYDKALFSGNVLSSEAWAVSLLANLLDKNTSGVNGLLDDVIDGVFGTSYNEAANRLKKLETNKEDRISLDPYFIEKLDLEDVFDEHDKIGWAEVNAVVSAMALVKASLEWLQTYDLNTDLNWLKHSWKDESTFASKLNGVSAQSLPFNNNFFKARTGKSMNNVKASYIKAIQGLQESYASIINSELYPTKVKESHTTINGGFDKLIAAIEGGNKFYIPENPTKGNWPAAKTNDVVGTIDFGKFFTAGYFSLENIFEMSGGKPVFYRGYEICDNYYYCDYEYEILTNSSLIENRHDEYYSELCLKLNISHIKSIADSDDVDYDEFKYIPILPSGKLAKAVVDKYY